MPIKYYWLISDTTYLIYYLFVFLAAIYTLWKIGYNKFTIVIVLVFWAGLFDFLDYINILPLNIYKILVFAYSLVYWGPNVVSNKYAADRYINLSFLIFTLLFFFSNIYNQQALITVFSQFSLKYAFPFLAYHGLKDISRNHLKAESIANIFIFIIKVQVVLSIIKIIVIGGFMEFLVGSLQFNGGGQAVSFPILALIIFWLVKKGHFNRKDWLIVFSFLIISLASTKRTPVFMFPLFVGLLSIYVPKRNSLIKILKYSPLVIILFIMGVKTNPTLNPQNSTWGSFNLNYTVDYAIQYLFGVRDVNYISESSASRGGSLFLAVNPESLGLKDSHQVFLGKGVADVATESKGRFRGGEGGYGLEHQGMVSRFVELIYTLGYFGLAFYLLFILSLVFVINNHRIRITVLLWFIIDFLLYYNTTIDVPALSFLFIYIILYSNLSTNNSN